MTEGKVPGTTPLDALKAKVEGARKTRWFDKPVPGIDQLVVRYGAISAAEVARIYKNRKNAPLEEQSIMVCSDICATACLGIYEVVEGELQTSGELIQSKDEGTPLTFATLGLANTGKAADEVRALYTTDGDVIGTSGRILDFNGFAGKDIQAAIQGE